MPALIHNSSAFSTQGVSLLSQSLQEQPSGLMRVSVEYAFTQAGSENLASLFHLDAPPPLFPTVVRRGDLQTQQLYLESHTAKKSFGQWRVQATYVGAKQVRRGFSGTINIDGEARVTPPVKLNAGYIFSDDDPPERITVYDVVGVKYIAQTITRSVAGVYTAWFDLENLGGDASGYIYRVEYGSISRAVPDVRTLNIYPAPLAVLRAFKPVLNTSTKIQNVTNAVIIATTIQEVVLSDLAGAERL
jgi:hypothetical protein